MRRRIVTGVGGCRRLLHHTGAKSLGRIHNKLRNPLPHDEDEEIKVIPFSLADLLSMNGARQPGS